jgi:hypothetical protein
MNEIIQCDRCGQDFEANHDDLGTYWHDKCYKPHLSIQDIDPNRLRGMMLKIYMDAKARLDRYKQSQRN